MKTYVLLERLTRALLTLPSEATVRHHYCQAQAAALATALLDDLEAITTLRGYVQATDLTLHPRKFGSGELYFTVRFDPHDQFSVLCFCGIGQEQLIQLQVLNETDSWPL